MIFIIFYVVIKPRFTINLLLLKISKKQTKKPIGIDGEVYLHNETDPRYRGPAIPSKAFKFLQTMTDGYQPDMSSTYQSYHGN